MLLPVWLFASDSPGTKNAQPRTETFHSLKELSDEIKYNDIRRMELVKKDWLAEDSIVLIVDDVRVYSVSKTRGDSGALIITDQYVPEDNLMIIGTVNIPKGLEAEKALAQVRHNDLVSIIGRVFAYEPPRTTVNRQSEFIRFAGIVLPQKLLPKKR